MRCWLTSSTIFTTGKYYSNEIIYLSLMLSTLFKPFYFCSAKRKEQYSEFLEFTEVEPLKILKHSTTRWLSLQKVVSRTLHHWDALSSYFNSHDQVESDGKIHRLAHLLKNPEVKMYFYYLEFILVPLNDFNTTFQASIMTFIIHFENVNACTLY